MQVHWRAIKQNYIVETERKSKTKVFLLKRNSATKKHVSQDRLILTNKYHNTDVKLETH